jgi:hypothetical protein
MAGSMVDLAAFYATLLGVPQTYYPYLHARYHQDTGALPGFLEGVCGTPVQPAADIQVVEVKVGDSRIDAPVWFGDLATAKVRIVVAGMEPRHSDNKFNVMRVGKKVYASPFGADKWRRNSKSIYYQAVSPLLVPDVFVLFTDLVKDYQVESLTDKQVSDKKARKEFAEKFLDHTGKLFSVGYRRMFEQECSAIAPTHLIAFGRETEQLLAIAGYTPLYVCHPANGGMNKAKEKIAELVSKL